MRRQIWGAGEKRDIRVAVLGSEKPRGLCLCKRGVSIGYIDAHIHTCTRVYTHTCTASLGNWFAVGPRRVGCCQMYVRERREVGSVEVGSGERPLGTHAPDICPCWSEKYERDVRTSIIGPCTETPVLPLLQPSWVQPCPAKSWVICYLQSLCNNCLPTCGGR